MSLLGGLGAVVCFVFVSFDVVVLIFGARSRKESNGDKRRKKKVKSKSETKNKREVHSSLD